MSNIPELHFKYGFRREITLFDVPPGDVAIFNGTNYGDNKWFIDIGERHFEIGSPSDKEVLLTIAAVRKTVLEALSNAKDTKVSKESEANDAH